jgi:hypothetical protein
MQLLKQTEKYPKQPLKKPVMWLECSGLYIHKLECIVYIPYNFQRWLGEV